MGGGKAKEGRERERGKERDRGGQFRETQREEAKVYDDTYDEVDI